jgi:hypothetical protein
MRRLTSLLGNSQKLDGGALFGNAPRAVWAGWLAPDEQNRVPLCCRCLLVEEADGRRILLETGIGAFFAPKLREWLKTLRRYRVYVVFASQSPADVARSPLFDVVKESCFTRIFLPNPNAAEAETAQFYRMFSLNARELEILAGATPKRDYYLSSPAGSRLFSLALGEIARAYCAATGDADLARAAPWIDCDAESFNRAWLQAQGLGWAAQMMDAAPAPAPMPPGAVPTAPAAADPAADLAIAPRPAA